MVPAGNPSKSIVAPYTGADNANMAPKMNFPGEHGPRMVCPSCVLSFHIFYLRYFFSSFTKSDLIGR